MTRETYILFGLMILSSLLAVGFATRRSTPRNAEGMPALSYAVVDEAGVTRALPAQRLPEARPADVEPLNWDPMLDGQPMHDDLPVPLDEGLAVQGSVRWPDGSPAAGARLALIPYDLAGHGWSLHERACSAEGSGSSDAAGSFRLGGLDPGAYALLATLDARDGSAASTPWTARATHVTAGTGSLELTLAAPLSFAGRVEGDAGLPIEAFTVVARRADWPPFASGPRSQVETSFTDSAGHFDLDGLDAGPWTLSLRADAHLTVFDRPVRVPAAHRSVFTLTRTATLSGTVRDPHGVPVAGAEVRARAESDDGRSDSVQTDADGRFSMSSVGPGPLMLSATADEWAPSVEDCFDLQPGEAHVGHIVDLTPGGRVTGMVYGRDGQPAPSRTIVLQDVQTGDGDQTLSDADGRFRFEHLAPGDYQVIAMPDEEDEASLDDDGQPRDLAVMLAQLDMTMARVVEGETVVVELGAPPRAPVELHGRVLRGSPDASGSPAGGPGLAGTHLMVIAEGGDFLDGLQAATTDDEGRFDLTLDAPGNHTVVVMASQESSIEIEVEFQVSIPEVEHHALDLVLPTGVIEGRVQRADGGVPEGAMLWIRRVDGLSDLSSFMLPGTIALQDDGRFRIETLHPGRYALSACGGDAGLVSAHDIVVSPGDRTPHVQLTLPDAGRLMGTVTDEAGAPLADATVLLRDAEGRPLYRLETTADGRGRFEIGQVPVGDVLISARTREQVSREPTRVQVLHGEDTKVELALQAGVVLHVGFEDEQGRATRAALQVLDDAGRNFVGHAGRQELERIFATKVTSTERRVGPLSPGRYTLRAVSRSGRVVQQDVTLHGDKGEHSVRLRLGDGG